MDEQHLAPRAHSEGDIASVAEQLRRLDARVGALESVVRDLARVPLQSATPAIAHEAAAPVAAASLVAPAPPPPAMPAPSPVISAAPPAPPRQR
ncbi:MAG: hypothetical protein U0841_08800 [Chloroflexia bacterium]